MIDETQTPGAGPEGTGQENSMGGASEWSTVPSAQPPLLRLLLHNHQVLRRSRWSLYRRHRSPFLLRSKLQVGISRCMGADRGRRHRHRRVGIRVLRAERIRRRRRDRRLDMLVGLGRSIRRHRRLQRVRV